MKEKYIQLKDKNKTTKVTWQGCITTVCCSISYCGPVYSSMTTRASFSLNLSALE